VAWIPIRRCCKFGGKSIITRLNPFARSWFYVLNRRAVKVQNHNCNIGMYRLWSKFTASSTRSPLFANRDFSVFSPQKIIGGGPSPHLGTAMQTTCSPLSFGKSFMKIRSAVPENGCLIFLADGNQNEKKTKKTSAKHIRYRLIGDCVNYRNIEFFLLDYFWCALYSWVKPLDNSWPINISPI